LIYWDIKNDRQVDLEDVNLISTPLVTPTSQTYSSGILSDNCTRTRLMNHLWDGNCGSEATGPNAEKVFIVGVNEPIGTYEYKLTATGHWDGTNFNYFHKIDQDRTNTFYGFRIIRDIWQIVIGITYSGGGTSEISESYWQTPAGFIQDHVVSSLTTNMYDSRFGIYTSTVGILDDRVEDPIGMFESIRVSPGGTTITGTYFEPDRGAITKADFDPIKTWIMTVSHETDTPPGPYESYYIRIDRFDNSDFAYIHDNTIILPNLADFWLSKGNLTLYGLYTGHVLGE